MTTRREDCSIPDDAGLLCPRPVEPGSPVPLCTQHLLVAYDWVARDAGVTDLLPSPCSACGSRVGVRYPSGWICAVCEWRVGDIPDAESSGGRVDVVYYLRYQDRIKIGTTANPRQRFASLPHDEVLAFELGGRTLEQRRHVQFAAYRIPHTEWFESNDELTRHIAELSEGVDDPWQVYAFWRSRRLALGG